MSNENNNNVKDADKKNMEKLSLEELDRYSGGTIGNAKKEDRKPIDESVSDRS